MQTFNNFISWQVSGRETNPECVCDAKCQQQRSPCVDHLWSSRQRMGGAPILSSHPAFLDSGQMILVFLIEVSIPMIAYEDMIFEYHMILGSAL